MGKAERSLMLCPWIPKFPGLDQPPNGSTAGARQPNSIEARLSRPAGRKVKDLAPVISGVSGFTGLLRHLHPDEEAQESNNLVLSRVEDNLRAFGTAMEPPKALANCRGRGLAPRRRDQDGDGARGESADQGIGA